MTERKFLAILKRAVSTAIVGFPMEEVSREQQQGNTK